MLLTNTIATVYLVKAKQYSISLLGKILILPFMLIFLSLLSCSAEEEIEEIVLDNGEVIPVTNFYEFSSRTIGENVIYNGGNRYKGIMLTGQAHAIYNNYLFRLLHSGYCYVYDISDIDDIKFINKFELGSWASSNHCNSAQFGNEVQPDTGFPLLYVGHTSKGILCNVEKISLTGSETIQSITMDNPIPIQEFIIGDDGYLWTAGCAAPGGAQSIVLFQKFERPPLEEKEAKINWDNPIDGFEAIESGNSIWQGMKVYANKLYFVTGSSLRGRRDRYISVYDLNKKKKIESIDINDASDGEPEDIDFIDGQTMLLDMYGVKHAALLNFNNRIRQ